MKNSFITTSKSTELLYIVHLNGRSVVYSLWLAIRRKPIVLIDIQSGFVVTRMVLNRIGRFLCRFGLARHIEDVVPPNERESLTSWIYKYPDFFAVVEKAQDHRFKFREVEQACPAYAYAYKHEVCKFTQNNMITVARLLEVFANFASRSQVVVGIEPEVSSIFEEYRGKELPVAEIRFSRSSKFANGMLSVLYMASSLAWALCRIGFRPAKSKHYFLAADFTPFDFKLLNFLREICDDDAGLLLVMRNLQELKFNAGWKLTENIDICLGTRGSFKLSDLPWVLKTVFTESWGVWQMFSDRPTPLFAELAKFPYRILTNRAFANAYGFDYFLGKDDYNVTHIFRSQELRRRRITSLGLSHGMPVPEGNYAPFRYNDFDVYFLCGWHLYESIYKETWPVNMRVAPIGSIGLHRDQIERLDDPRPKNIVIFYTYVPENDAILEFIDVVAHYFSDRTLYIRHKRSLSPGSLGCRDGMLRELKGFERDWDPPRNVVQVFDRFSYDLMLEARYALTTRVTSMTAEAIHYGMITYVMDVYDDNAWSYWKQFPGLCLSSPQQFIDNVIDIESGKSGYAVGDIDDLVESSGRIAYDIVREELGLPSKAQGPRHRKSPLAVGE